MEQKKPNQMGNSIPNQNLNRVSKQSTGAINDVNNNFFAEKNVLVCGISSLLPAFLWGAGEEPRASQMLIVPWAAGLPCSNLKS